MLDPAITTTSSLRMPTSPSWIASNSWTQPLPHRTGARAEHQNYRYDGRPARQSSRPLTSCRHPRASPRDPQLTWTTATRRLRSWFPRSGKEGGPSARAHRNQVPCPCNGEAHAPAQRTPLRGQARARRANGARAPRVRARAEHAQRREHRRPPERREGAFQSMRRQPATPAHRRPPHHSLNDQRGEDTDQANGCSRPKAGASPDAAQAPA